MIEEQLERIATSLETIAAVYSGAGAGGDDTPIGKEKATRKGKGKGKGKGKDKGPTSEDVKIALTTFVEDGPGKDPAKKILKSFDAGSISTLDESKYADFITALEAASDDPLV